MTPRLPHRERVTASSGAGPKRPRGPALAALAALAACGPVRADDPAYEIRIASDVTVAAGAAGAVSVTIVPSGNRTVSADGPIRLAVDAPAGLALPRRRYARKDAADPAAEAPRFEVKLRAKDPGDHTVSLELRFWLCGSRVCRPIATTRSVVVHVPAPAPPVDAGIDTAVDAGVDAAMDAGVRGRRR